MSTNKRYNSLVSVDETSGLWRAEILRRASSKRNVVSKMQEGFATEDEANKWAEESLVEFLALNERNKRQSKSK
tara:strand:+ start:135 stop:356 length:222 start_codon:yes stop_codon:yes gene_type:complete